MRTLAPLLLLAATIPAYPQARIGAIEQDVTTSEGIMHFSLTMCVYSETMKGFIPDLRGFIDNQTGTTWPQSQFKLTFSDKNRPLEVLLDFDRIRPGKTEINKFMTISFSKCEALSEFNVEHVFGAERVADARAEEKRQTALRSAEMAAQKRADAQRAAERAKLRANCLAVYNATADKKVKDLTVREEQAVRACQSRGLYPPQ